MMKKHAHYVAESKGAFIRAFESGDLQSDIVSAFEMRGERIPSESEQRSWGNSLAFLALVLVDEQIPDDIEILCEYTFDEGRSKRADVIMLNSGQGDDDYRSAVVVELKQWDKFFLIDWEDKLADGEKGAELNDPTEQVMSYCKALKGVLPSRCNLNACVFMHNLTRDEDSEFGICKKDVGKVAVFYRGEIAEMRTFLNRYLGDALPAGAALKRAEEKGYWGKDLPKTAGELRSILIDKLHWAEPLGEGMYDYVPTDKCKIKGITPYSGYNIKERKRYTVCGFSDTAMRELAEMLRSI